MENNTSMFCFYCGRKTDLIYKEIRKSFNHKMVTIYNVPLFYCKNCREVFYPDFVIDAFKNFAKSEEQPSKCDFKSLSLTTGC